MIRAIAPTLLSQRTSRLGVAILDRRDTVPAPLFSTAVNRRPPVGRLRPLDPKQIRVGQRRHLALEPHRELRDHLRMLAAAGAPGIRCQERPVSIIVRLGVQTAPIIEPIV